MALSMASRGESATDITRNLGSGGAHQSRRRIDYNVAAEKSVTDEV